MATQAAIFAETIAGMKKAVKRKAYGTVRSYCEPQTSLLILFYDADSDSDSSIEQLTNRGNKLRKKARFVHEGQLAPPTGPQVYKRVRQQVSSKRFPQGFQWSTDVNSRESSMQVSSETLSVETLPSLTKMAMKLTVKMTTRGHRKRLLQPQSSIHMQK